MEKKQLTVELVKLMATEKLKKFRTCWIPEKLKSHDHDTILTETLINVSTRCPVINAI